MTAGRVRLAVRATGELLVTAGLILLLFVVYQLVWTGVETNLAQQQLRREWAAGPPVVGAGSAAVAAAPSPSPAAPAAAVPTPAPPAAGTPVAVLYIPRLGPGWSRVVVEGVAPADLKKGPGHYPGTALPGQVGNVGIAGHRATNGEPFRDLDRLRPGDPVVLQTADGYFTYTVDRSTVVLPTQVDVLLPVPQRPGVAPTTSLLTLTTCEPRWASTYRLIVFAHLVGQQPVSAGPPAVLAG